MKKLESVFFRSMLAWLLLAGCVPGLPAREPLPPAVTGLFPRSVSGITGEFVSQGPMIIVDIRGNFPTSGECNTPSQQTGGMHIRLTVYRGETAILAQRFADGMADWVKQEREKMDSLIAGWKGNSQIDQAGPVHVEDAAGGKALWLEYGGPCAMSEFSRYRHVQLTCSSVQGAAVAEVEIFCGEAAQARSMLADALDRIARLDYARLAKQ